MLADIDRAIFGAMKSAGLDTFDALFYRTGAAEPIQCTVTLDTLELTNEYGVTVIESGAKVGYLVEDIGNPGVGDYFEFNGHRYVIDDKEPSQDTSVRYAHCSVRQL